MEVNDFEIITDFMFYKAVSAYPAKILYLNFYPLQVVSRYRDPQLQLPKNYAYLINLRTNIYKSWCLDPHFIPNNSDSID